jgi:hypothetical protein
MTSAAIQNIEDLATTWRELESQARVKLRAIGSERFQLPHRRRSFDFSWNKGSYDKSI